MDFDALRGHVREMERVLDEFTGGRKSEDALAAIKHISIAMRRTCEGNPDIIEKLRRLEVFADVLYSGRKPERYRGPGVVKMIMRSDLAGLGFHISRLERVAEPAHTNGTNHRSTKIIDLRNRISFLESRENTLRESIGSALTAPDVRESAKNELSLVLSEAWMAVTELERLEAKK